MPRNAVIPNLRKILLKKYLSNPSNSDLKRILSGHSQTSYARNMEILGLAVVARSNAEAVSQSAWMHPSQKKRAAHLDMILSELIQEIRCQTEDLSDLLECLEA